MERKDCCFYWKAAGKTSEVHELIFFMRISTFYTILKQQFLWFNGTSTTCFEIIFELLIVQARGEEDPGHCHGAGRLRLQGDIELHYIYILYIYIYIYHYIIYHKHKSCTADFLIGIFKNLIWFWIVGLL